MEPFRYAGNGLSQAMLTMVRGMIVLEPGTTLTVAQAKTLAGWQDKINPATSAAIVGTYIDTSRGFEDKTKAPEFTESNVGLVEKTNDFPMQFVAHGLLGYEDYRTWFSADNRKFNFVLCLDNGDIMCAFNSAGLVVGFEGIMYLTFKFPATSGAEKQKAAEFNVMFSDVEQTKDYHVVETTFNRSELNASVPVGIKIEVITPYEASGGTVVLRASQRGSKQPPYAGFTAYTQWVVISTDVDSGGAATAISATQAPVGIYTLTFLNGAAKMTGDFKIQAETIASSHVTYLSNVLNVNV